MTTNLPRGGKTGKSIAPRRTVHKDKGIPALWIAFLKDLKKFREDAGLSVAEAAEVLGVTPAKIYIWENGKSTPHPYDLCVYLEVLGVKRFHVE